MTAQLLDELKQIILEDYELEMSKEQTIELANFFVNCFEILSKTKQQRNQVNREIAEIETSI